MVPTTNPLELRQARRLLATNAFFTLVCAVPMVIFGDPLAIRLFDARELALLVKVVGLGLLGYAVFLLAVALRPGPRIRRWLLAFAIADLAWVLATAVLMTSGVTHFTATGRAAAVGVALLVGYFGWRQLALARTASW